MSDQDPYAQRSTEVASQARGASIVTPSDSTDLTVDAKALYIGTGGDITVTPINNVDGTSILFANHPVGYLRVQVKRVWATGTAADNIVALTA